jgi:acetylglutamate kinase
LTTLVLKLGGELVETPAQRVGVAALAASITATRSLVLVHGGGRSIDAELDRRGIAPKKIDGLRVTDADTLDVVVSVLAGSTNTLLVAALVANGVRAVGLTGADAGLGRAARVSAHQSTSGAVVDLGFVGDPVDADGSLLTLLTSHGYVPVVASIGIDDANGAAGLQTGGYAGLLNVNADVMACRIAAALPSSDLVIAGTTPGVLDASGESIAELDSEAIGRLISGGTATAGMIAKLSACRGALADGVASIRLVDGRGLRSLADVETAAGTTLTAQPAWVQR